MEKIDSKNKGFMAGLFLVVFVFLKITVISTSVFANESGSIFLPNLDSATELMQQNEHLSSLSPQNRFRSNSSTRLFQRKEKRSKQQQRIHKRRTSDTPSSTADRVQSMIDIDATDAYQIGIPIMEETDPNARLVEIWGLDSGIEDYFWDYTDNLIPTGLSYEWELVFVNDDTEEVHFLLLFGTEPEDIETYYIPDLPYGEQPPVDISAISTVTENFISSQDVFLIANNYGLDESLDNLDPDSWFEIEYIISSYYFLYEDHFDETSPSFWEVLVWEDKYDPDDDIFVELLTIYLIDAYSGSFIDRITRRFDFGDPGDNKIDLNEVFGQTVNFMMELNENSVFLQGFGSEDFFLPELPDGKSEGWMMVWMDFDTERIDLFFSSGNQIYEHDSFFLEDLPEDDRFPMDHIEPIGSHFLGSEDALEIAMMNGLWQFTQSLPEDIHSTWINYVLTGVLTPYEDLLGDIPSDPIWEISMTAQQFDESHLPVFNERSIHLINAVSGQYLAGTTITAAEEEKEIVTDVILFQNYPNPFNPVTTIYWTMDAANHVSLTVYDLLGREVATLANGPKQAGTHSVTFNSDGLSSGVYIYRLETDRAQLYRKMTIVK